MTDKLKQFIFNNLIKDLSNAEIIRHDESLWFIDREKKYWYLELVKTGKLYWRYQFFTEFFNMYSIDRDVYEPIIKEFVELVLNNGITSTAAAQGTGNKPLEDALNNGVTSTETTMAVSSKMVSTVLNNGITSTQVEYGVFRNEKVEDALNNGVTSTTYHPFAEHEKVDSVLNSDIKSSRPANKSLTIVDSVLNDGVTTKLRGGNATEQIKSVLKNGVKSADCEFLSLESEVDSVLTNGITSTGSNRLLSHTKLDLILKKGVSNLMPLDAYRENMINYVLKDNPS